MNRNMKTGTAHACGCFFAFKENVPNGKPPRLAHSMNRKPRNSMKESGENNPGAAWLGLAWHGQAGRGRAWHGTARRGVARLGGF